MHILIYLFLVVICGIFELAWTSATGCLSSISDCTCCIAFSTNCTQDKKRSLGSVKTKSYSVFAERALSNWFRCAQGHAEPSMAAEQYCLNTPNVPGAVPSSSTTLFPFSLGTKTKRHEMCFYSACLCGMLWHWQHSPCIQGNLSHSYGCECVCVCSKHIEIER